MSRDENTLAAHAYWEHNVTTKEGFDDLYSIYIIKNKDPAQLTYSEQFLINYFYTVRPYGLNVSNPIGPQENLAAVADAASLCFFGFFSRKSSITHGLMLYCSIITNYLLLLKKYWSV